MSAPITIRNVSQAHNNVSVTSVFRSPVEDGVSTMVLDPSYVVQSGCACPAHVDQGNSVCVMPLLDGARPTSLFTARIISTLKCPVINVERITNAQDADGADRRRTERWLVIPTQSVDITLNAAQHLVLTCAQPPDLHGET